MLKTYITFILLMASSILFAQNIEFKSSNFKDKKEEFKVLYIDNASDINNKPYHY